MSLLVLSLILPAALLSLMISAVVRRLSLRLNVVDTEAIDGQVKLAARCIPNTGGIGIFLAIVGPMVAVLLLSQYLGPKTTPESLNPYLDSFAGIRSVTFLAIWLLAAMTLLHVLGLIDDRRPLGPWGKLIIMVIPAVLVVWPMDTRLLTMLDPVAGGPWLSILITILWIVCVTNAMNFIDNMDGYAAGVATIVSGGFLAAALLQEQWFVAGVLALVCGASLGFLLLNFPPAKLFMGDCGSLVLGFLLAFLTVRTTFVPESTEGDPFSSGQWYPLLMPLVVLGVPLYDFTTVTVLRLTQGKSPFKGDLQHLSHRLVQRGMSGRTAVLVIYGFTAMTAIAGVLLARAEPTQAILVGTLIALLFTILAVVEYASPPARVGPRDASHG